jgi:hypothetical protein
VFNDTMPENEGQEAIVNSYKRLINQFSIHFKGDVDLPLINP